MLDQNNFAILNAMVMHKRLKPSKNGFSYRVYYVVLPLSMIEASIDQTVLAETGLRYNHFGMHAIYHQDHGYRDGRTWRQWVHDQLEYYQQPLWPDITLLTMPRVLGYVFNPVSFWLCRDQQQQLRAVICEVNNTFGETHSYLCLPNQTGGMLDGHQALSTNKIFHVSPFLPRRGKYDFRFNLTQTRCDIFIDYCDISEQSDQAAQNRNCTDSSEQTMDADFEKVLLTSLRGEFSPLTPRALTRAFWRCPLVTLKAITLIHYQALKIILKKIRYIKKPQPLTPSHSATYQIKADNRAQSTEED